MWRYLQQETHESSSSKANKAYLLSLHLQLIKLLQ